MLYAKRYLFNLQYFADALAGEFAWFECNWANVGFHEACYHQLRATTDLTRRKQILADGIEGTWAISHSTLDWAYSASYSRDHLLERGKQVSQDSPHSRRQCRRDKMMDSLISSVTHIQLRSKTSGKRLRTTARIKTYSATFNWPCWHCCMIGNWKLNELIWFITFFATACGMPFKDVV